jgi:D-alanyl-D-alanine carboxypeptidase
MLGALAAAVVFYPADVGHAASSYDQHASHELPRATHESSSGPPYAAIVLDVNSGKVLHSANADELRHPASLTKIMTLYLLFERLESGKLKLDTPLPVSEHASIQAPTKLGLKPDQTIEVEDAIGGLVTKSANDAAVVVAEAIAGDEHEFARLMTRKARALGMSRTVYRNASGLPNDEQVTTARDQATLGRAIQERFPRYYRYFAMPSFTYQGQTMRNHNQLLGQVEGLDGIKTGYIQASGFNLVTSVRRNNRHIVSVVLGGASAGARDVRMRSLIEEYIVAAAPQKNTTAIAEARRAPIEMRAAESRVREAHDAEPNTRGTRSADAQPANQPTAPAIYSVASSERPAAWPLPSATPSSTTGATIAAPPSAAPLADETPTASAPAGMQAPLASDPIRPIPVKTVKAKLPPTFGTPAHEQIEIPEAHHDDASARQSSAPPQALVKPQPALLPQKAGMLLGTLVSRDQPARDATLQSAPHQAAPSGAADHSGWSIQIGAFANEQDAHKKLSTAQAKATQFVNHASPSTEAVVKGDNTLYRARFAGLQRDEAEMACRQLKRSGIDCIIIKN